MRPGESALTLLVQYALPYSDGVTISHPLFYDTASGAIILADNGVQVGGADWVEGTPQSFGEGQVFRNFGHAPLSAGQTLTIQLEGRPSVVNDSSGAPVANRNTTNELLIGGGTLLLAAVGGIFLWRYWQGRRETAEEPAPAYVAPAGAAAPPERDALLRQIAALDDAFEAGRLDEADYRAQRDQLKRRLAAVWEK